MGKTKLKLMDDSAPAEEQKKPKKKSEKVAKHEEVKFESVKTSGEVESAPEAGETVSEVKSSESKVVMDDSAAETKSEDKDKSESSKKKPGKAKPRSKKYQEISKDLDRSKSYPLTDAVDMVKKMSYAKFNATIEAHINTTQTGLRGFISLPYASGKKLKILAFPPAKLNSSDKKELEDEGVILGSESTLDELSKAVNFDLVITSPEWMPSLAKVAKVLGPKGLMPNPKNGTITNDLKKTISEFQSGKVEYKTEAKAPVIHLSLGKTNQPNEELSANIKIFLATLGKTKIKKVSLSPTMGPSVKLDLASI